MSFRSQKRRISQTLQLDGSSKVQTNRRISAPSLEPLEDMVICPIDLNLLEDPRLLPCGHAFCCKCLTHYMYQLPHFGDTNKEKLIGAETFACPICRMTCPVPASKSASCFPKAFNHIVILEYLRKNQMSTFKTQADSNVIKSRKNSIQVNSQMLNYIARDIAARERDGKIRSEDRAVILDGVTVLLKELGANDSLIPSMQSKNAQTQFSNMTCPKRDSSTPSTVSPAGSQRNLGRFNIFAAKVRRTRRTSRSAEISSDVPSYTTYRDTESVRLMMKDNSVYRVLSKGKDCCILRLGEAFQPVDMRLEFVPKAHRLLRRTITADETRLNLIMWHQQMDLKSGLFSVSKQKCGKVAQLFTQTCGSIDIGGCGPIKVQYLRFYGDQVYLTGIASPISNGQYGLYTEVLDQTDELQKHELFEYGLVVCCDAMDMSGPENQGSDQTKSLIPFPVRATSCIFRRDSVGCERLDQPILYGFDIDQSSGDIYVAQPANAMICRLNAMDLTRINGTWYLNDPQLSPHFLCYAEVSKQIWATCQREEKIAILDLETDGFHHFNPTLSFGINPSHIIYTSDSRIVMLDKSQSRMFWITKIHQTICVQCLDVHFASRLKRQLLVIQPVNDVAARALMESTRGDLTPLGGILCVTDYGCSIISPARKIARMRLSTFHNCTLCGR